MKKDKLPIVELPEFDIKENGFEDCDGSYWSTATLFTHSKDLPVWDCPVASLRTDGFMWGDWARSPGGLEYHAKRMMDADVTKPIILDEGGVVMDGGHRIARALIEGRTTIPAVRFQKNPPADRKEKK